MNKKEEVVYENRGECSCISSIVDGMWYHFRSFRDKAI
jgi:hypothetical protein